VRLGRGTGDSLLNGSLKDQQMNQSGDQSIIWLILFLQQQQRGGLATLRVGGEVAISKDSSPLAILTIVKSSSVFFSSGSSFCSEIGPIDRIPFFQRGSFFRNDPLLNHQQ